MMEVIKKVEMTDGGAIVNGRILPILFSDNFVSEDFLGLTIEQAEEMVRVQEFAKMDEWVEKEEESFPFWLDVDDIDDDDIILEPAKSVFEMQLEDIGFHFSDDFWFDSEEKALAVIDQFPSDENVIRIVLIDEFDPCRAILYTKYR